ncbi:MAG: hypothetical protein KDI73_06330 [Candidatus Competibacteraceae bacterium]|nr:hypothetical protein [Candidatus Competibacteraceae bacterium]
MNRGILSLLSASTIAISSFSTVSQAAEEFPNLEPVLMLAQAQDGTKETKKRADQVAEKFGDLGGDDLIVNAIIRAANKQERMNKLLKEKGSKHRVPGIEVENGIPPKIVFTVTRESN